jgi:hypothetical protein
MLEAFFPGAGKADLLPAGRNRQMRLSERMLLLGIANDLEDRGFGHGSSRGSDEFQTCGFGAGRSTAEPNEAT